MLVHVMVYIFKAIWYILRSYGMLYGHLVYFSRFGILYKDKSGNPGRSRRRKKPEKKPTAFGSDRWMQKAGGTF
jgi:polyferredoxin